MALYGNDLIEVRRRVNQMQSNSQAMLTASETEKEDLVAANKDIAKSLRIDYGINATESNGNWVLSTGERLYEKYGSTISDGYTSAQKLELQYTANTILIKQKEIRDLENEEDRETEIEKAEEEIEEAVQRLYDNYGIELKKDANNVWVLDDGRKLSDAYGNIMTIDPASSSGSVKTNSILKDATSLALRMGDTSRSYWRTSALSSVKSPTKWGILPGYSWDVEGSPDGGMADESWRRYTEFAKTWMGDGIPSGDPDTRRLIHWQKFDRFYSVDHEHEGPSKRHYIFMLRPDLHLLQQNEAQTTQLHLSNDSRVAHDDFFTYLSAMHPEIVASLTGDFAGLAGASLSGGFSAATGSGLGNSATSDGTTLNGIPLTIHTFIPYLTSRVESLQLPDYKVKDDKIVQPYTKYSIPYTGSSIESQTGGSFSIEFREDRYYSIHKLFYAWLYYQDGVARNIFTPKEKYILYNTLDYATSVYDFVVDETGENVIYWAKYTGCVPVNVPMADLGFNRGDPQDSAAPKVSIDFNYFYCEHMKLMSLRDFQYNSLGHVYMKRLGDGIVSGNTHYSQFNPCSLSETEPMYSMNDHYGASLTGRPVLIFVTGPGGDRQIKLRWLIDPDMTKTKAQY